MSSLHNTNHTDPIFIQSLNPLHIHSNLLSCSQIPEPTPLNSQNNPTINQEINIEKEIIRAITSGKSDPLKPNSGQAVPIGEHYVCVSFHEEAESDYRVWEWHGHVVSYDEKNRHTQEYVYGNYFERTMKQPLFVEESDEEIWEEAMGLKDLIGGLNLANGRVLCRNIGPNYSRSLSVNPRNSTVVDTRF